MAKHPIYDDETLIVMEALISLIDSGRTTVDEIRQLAEHAEGASLDRQAAEATEERLLESGLIEPRDS